MFYKNGDAFCGAGWDDSPLSTVGSTTFVPISPLIQVYWQAFLSIVRFVHAPRGKTCRVKHSRILLSTKLMTLKVRTSLP
ncbi:hypothetical protein C3432_09890 [Citrobacter amalonaticus]|uniref:Uncharacterized protein n=1 Tax=Citrobacter amalonaticus TaxID=35703 RepID=A0A2S4S067_CITAM|nr:hypothetical protein C3432_09890 [Citrobacter amalonaticus]POT76268.1 hypothetical protein C3436_01930 [Citrobacter amalonaticus]POU66733.1 hypothetical protein C3430_08090 [Citrobacter amalonaticus]POV05503.1 hypothetical protein C3424_09235 [Citrobacter amalonaticus]